MKQKAANDLTIREAAEMVGVTEHTVRSWVQADRFPTYRSVRRRIIEREPFIAWAKAENLLQ